MTVILKSYYDKKMRNIKLLRLRNYCAIINKNASI